MPQIFFPPQGTNLTSFSEDKKKKGMAALDSVEGILQKRVRTLVLSNFAWIVASFLCIGLLVYAVNLPKMIPVVVTVDSDGRANYVGKVDKSLYGNTAIPESAKCYQMKRLIRDMFTKLIDADAQQSYIAEANSIVQRGAVRQLDSFYRENNPFEKFGEFTQSVEIEQPLRQTDKTYFVNFTVTRKTPDGHPRFSENYTALMNIEFYASIPESNPLGIFITNFDIKKKN